MPTPPESPLSVDSDSAISDDTAVKMEHPSGEELGQGSSSPGVGTRLTTVQESRSESAEEPASSHQKEAGQPQEDTSVARGDAADSRPEANPAVAEVPQAVAGSTAQPSGSQPEAGPAGLEGDAADSSGSQPFSCCWIPSGGWPNGAGECEPTQS